MKTDHESILRRVATESFQAVALAVPQGKMITREYLIAQSNRRLRKPVTDANADEALAFLVKGEILKLVRPNDYQRITPADPYKAAVDRLQTKPGMCPVEGCGEMLLCCSVERWDGEDAPMPTPRFCCPEHDVWLGDCFDEGYPEDKDYQEGLYTATLRDPSAPAYQWIAEQHRPALARSGLGMSMVFAYPSMRAGIAIGKTWVMDRSNVIAVGPEDIFETTLDGITPEVIPATARPKTMVEHTISADFMAQGFASFTPEDYHPATIGKPTDHGHSTRWDKTHSAIGGAAIPTRMLEFVNALHPTATWFFKSKIASAVAVVDGQPVAFIQPADTIKADVEINKAEKRDAKRAKKRAKGTASPTTTEGTT